MSCDDSLSTPRPGAAVNGAAWAGEPPRALATLEFNRAFAYFDRYYSRYLPADKASRVLDFGCGFGSFLVYLKQRGYRNVLGFDADRRCVDFCLQQVSKSVSHAEDSRAFLWNNEAQFDFILVREVVYYFPASQSSEYFRALRAALKPAGRIIVEVFNGSLATGTYPSLNDHWIATVFTEHSLRWALDGSGFNVIDLFGATGTGAGLRYSAWRAAGRIWGSLLRAIYLLERGRDALNPTILDKNLIAVAECRN